MLFSLIIRRNDSPALLFTIYQLSSDLSSDPHAQQHTGLFVLRSDRIVSVTACLNGNAKNNSPFPPRLIFFCQVSRLCLLSAVLMLHVAVLVAVENSSLHSAAHIHKSQATMYEDIQFDKSQDSIN